MLTWAKEEADRHGLSVIEVIWVPGAMEVPLAIDRLLDLTSSHTGTVEV